MSLQVDPKKWTDKDVSDFAAFCVKYNIKESEETIDEEEENSYGPGFFILKAFRKEKINQFASEKESEVRAIVENCGTAELCQKIINAGHMNWTFELSEHLSIVSEKLGVKKRISDVICVYSQACAANIKGIKVSLVLAVVENISPVEVFLTNDSTEEEKSEKMLHAVMSFLVGICLVDQADKIAKYR